MTPRSDKLSMYRKTIISSLQAHNESFHDLAQIMHNASVLTQAMVDFQSDYRPALQKKIQILWMQTVAWQQRVERENQETMARVYKGVTTVQQSERKQTSKMLIYGISAGMHNQDIDPDRFASLQHSLVMRLQLQRKQMDAFVHEHSKNCFDAELAKLGTFLAKTSKELVGPQAQQLQTLLLMFMTENINGDLAKTFLSTANRFLYQ